MSNHPNDNSSRDSSLRTASSNLSTATIASNSNDKFTIRVLTLNCWGLWLGARRRKQRMSAIVRYLRENNCDVVFLQEVWVTSDFEFIRDTTQDIYRFAHLFRSGSVLGSSGIVILCKWLPKVIHFEPYSLNGSPFYPWHGDWFAGKGIAYSRVDFDGLSLHLFSTHTHAYYKENEPIHDQYSVHRVCQSYQLARFITFISDTACNRKVDGKDLLIVAGDMNSTSSELPYKILTHLASLTDCFKTSRHLAKTTSNIIHRHKILSYRQRVSRVDDNKQCEHSGFCRSKVGENSILDTLDEYRCRIAHALFDSDTDDEDITYCHPRNSFTPASLDYKPMKNAIDSSTPPPSFGAETVTENKSSSDSNSYKLTNPVGFDYQPNSQVPARIKSRKSRSKKSPMKRIDFILCRLLTHGHCTVDRIASQSKDPALDCSLSDHEPVLAELTISDVSHDLIDRNNYVISSDHEPTDCMAANHISGDLPSGQSSRPLASIVEAKVSATDVSQLHETTDQWVPEKAPVTVTYQDYNIQVLEETQDILMQYYQYNRRSKTQLFYIVLFMFIITLPTTTYYAITNELIPISTIIFMWLAAAFLFALGCLVGFLCYRYEQGAIEAILNDIICKISVAKDNQHLGYTSPGHTS